jgi:hypothetical protein
MTSPGRRYASVLVALLLASAGVIVSYGATWALALVPVFTGADALTSPGREVDLTGRDLAPLGAAMGWVGLAAVPALLATRTWGRRVTGAVVLVGGGVAGVTAVAFALTDVASGGGGAFVAAALGEPDLQTTSVSITAWWAVAVVSGLVMLASGLLALVDGPAWPRLGSRYSRSASTSAPASAAAAWDALDRGEDPTLDAEPRVPPGSVPGSMERTEQGNRLDGNRLDEEER